MIKAATSMRRFGKLLLDKHFHASGKGSNTHDPYAVAVAENHHTHPLVVTPSYSKKIFTVKTFVNYPEIVKFNKVFTHERFLVLCMVNLAKRSINMLLKPLTNQSFLQVI